MELRPEAANAMTIRQINRWFRLRDRSHLWPVKGHFNATDRAINRLRRLGHDWKGAVYASTLDAEIGRIVNSCV